VQSFFKPDALPITNQQKSLAGPHLFSNHQNSVTGEGVSLPDVDREDARKKTKWDCVKNDMESLGLSKKDVQFRNR